jgi:hypothetical protein
MNCYKANDMEGSQKQPQQEPLIKECFVAFIDILGFSQMIENDKGTGEQLKVIKSAIGEASNFMDERKKAQDHPYAFWYKNFQVKSFSDCFCFSIPLEFDQGEKDYKQNFVSFYVWLEVFCNTLLKNGFLCRGGITQGWHYYDDRIIFSKALVDAYLLESKQANHPMIMLHQQLIDNLAERSFPEQGYYEYMFVHDRGGRTFLHPFNYSIVDELFFGFGQVLLPKFIEERAELVQFFLAIIEDNISNLTGNPAVEKWQWLKELSHYTISPKSVEKFDTGFFIKPK